MFLTIVLIIMVIVALILIIPLFTRKDYAIERSVTISKPKQDVFNYIRYLKNQDNYSKWATMDPAMKKEYRGTDGTAGFWYAWDSDKKNVGKGEQEIIKVNEGDSVEYKIHFIKPFEGLADSVMSTTAVADSQTQVKWAFKSKMKYPMNIMLLVMNIEKMVGDDLQIGLDNLKALQERTA